MTACGCFIINAPWELEKKLNDALSKILPVLKKSDEAKFELKILKQ
jgi:23S rRNA A2030 N6-methylase RlmJ